MVKIAIILNSETFTIRRSHYPSGHLSLALVDNGGLPVAEISIDIENAELAPNEIILKNYSGNISIVRPLIQKAVIRPTVRVIQVGRHQCPVSVVPDIDDFVIT